MYWLGSLWFLLYFNICVIFFRYLDWRIIGDLLVFRFLGMLLFLIMNCFLLLECMVLVNCFRWFCIIVFNLCGYIFLCFWLLKKLWVYMLFMVWVMRVVYLLLICDRYICCWVVVFWIGLRWVNVFVYLWILVFMFCIRFGSWWMIWFLRIELSLFCRVLIL